MRNFSILLLVASLPSLSALSCLPLLGSSLLTDQNRRHYDVVGGSISAMHGGWGPHLRGIMRMNDDSLWFVSDAGPDVNHNTHLNYYMKDSMGWTWVDSQPQLGAAHGARIQQNTASISDGEYIYSYGIDVAGRRLQECYFHTQIDYSACNWVTPAGYSSPLSLNHAGPYQGPNYIGAAIAPDGARVVWWAQVGASAGSGLFQYTFNSGSGWNAPGGQPFTSAISNLADGRNLVDFSYVHSASDPAVPNRLHFMAQVGLHDTTPTEYRGVVASLARGGNLELTHLLDEAGDFAYSSGDIFLDPSTGDLHVTARLGGGETGYYFKPAGAEWIDHNTPVETFEQIGGLYDSGPGGVYRSRFVHRDGSDKLHLVLGGLDGGASFEQGSLVPGHPVDWGENSSLQVPLPDDGFDQPSAIFAESPSYQATPVRGIHFAICGDYLPAYAGKDNEIWFVDYRRR